MDNYTDLEFVDEALAKQNRKQLIKVIAGGALLGVVGAITLVMFLNMLVAFDWLSDKILEIIGGL